MALPSKFFLWFCCSAWLCFPISLGSQASREAAQIAASAELESEAEPWSLLQPLNGGNRSGLLPALFKVLYDGQGGAPRLQPDSRALRYMKRLYKAYATKEGIPKSNRGHLYNTVRLFTPCAQHKQAPGDQVAGTLPSVDLLFNLDCVTAVEHLLKSVLLYTFNNSVSFPSAVKCVCNLVIKEPESKTLPGTPYSFTFNSQFEFRKKYKWIEMDVTPLLQPLVASNKKSIHMSVNLTCGKDQLQHPSAQDSPLNTTLLLFPSLLLYLNDTSAQAYHRWHSLHYKRRPSQGPDQKRDLSACPEGEGAAEGITSSRHRRSQEAVSSELKKPLVPASLNLSEYFKQFLFPQNECELHDFRLSFSQLKWDNWIVAPQRYNPRYCKGDCPRAVGHRYGSPVHTMVQNIIHEKLDSSVPRPSCVPAKYSPLSVLTIESDGSITYKEYEDMIATKCTCR
ncbi:growth/differentiation factor 9 [Equus caballus]|uniref:Growth/differentiation factor 9 n=3 Tax=Equus caballus TaxID=9796 RepID=A0A1P8DA98_HORSE|nr:growth/differentiation factor 9 [Equus caballus]XP_008536598.1 PREDICTED: growth/differentiation factor 9 [Equus przewalskii]APU53485.1 GDF9 [Equus caballus]APU53486.1 GDF9 [Equus caballus]APU53487.1 GDF9 [Equus caballus]